MDYVDIMRPEGAVVAIYKGWQVSHKRHKLLQSPHSGRDAQAPPLVPTTEHERLGEHYNQRHLKFINATNPKEIKGAEARKIVRTHVRNKCVWDARQMKKAAQRKSNPQAAHSTYLPGISTNRNKKLIVAQTETSRDQIFEQKDANPTVPRTFGLPSALCIAKYPIDMKANTHELLSGYLTYASRRMYPIASSQTFNPLRSPEWFHYAVSDSAMLHAILYAGSIYLALLEGRTESKDSIHHLSKTISIVNLRLNESTAFIEDSTMGAISCLALGEAVSGKIDLWRTHMCGLKQMLATRKDICSIGGMLQAKLRRSDITGAIDFGAVPILDFEPSERLPIWSALPSNELYAIQRDITGHLMSCQVHPSLVKAMVDLAYFSRVLQYARLESSYTLNHMQFSEDMNWIEYRFLSFPKSLADPCQQSEADTACRMGGLLYMKAILQEYPHSSTGSSILLKQLQQSLIKIPIVESYIQLLVWLSFVGSGLARTEMKTWFVSFLGRLLTNFRIASFDDEKLAMSRILYIREVVGRSVEKLWAEAVTVGRCMDCKGVTCRS